MLLSPQAADMLLDSWLPSKIKKTQRCIASLPRGIWNRSMARLTYQSFRLLLNLEWLLLATAVIIETLLPIQPSWSVLGRVTAIVIFGLMGLWLPQQNLAAKLLYTALGFGVILFAVLEDGLSNRSIFLLCLVLVIRSCLLFKRFGQLVVLVLSLLIYATPLLIKPVGAGRGPVLDWRFSNILLFSLTLVFALLLINALIAERQSREQLEIVHQELALTHTQLRQYALRIEDQATLQERNRIAREIHDGLGHTLAAQTIQLNNALLFWQSDSDQAVTFLKQAKQLGSEALLEVRKSVSVLRSNPIQGQRLEVALEKLLADFHQTTGIEVKSNIQPFGSLPLELNVALFRIVQESLTNIAKHAQATIVTVTLQRADQLYLRIDDNGRGFHPTQNTTGFGLQGMRERAAALGGNFTIESQPGAGCHVAVSFPLSQHVI
jgi:signal transduction histidine kinase